MSHVCPASCQSVLHGKNGKVAHYMQSFHPFCVCVPAIFTGTIDFYHVIPLSVTLTWGKGEGGGGGGGEGEV